MINANFIRRVENNPRNIQSIDLYIPQTTLKIEWPEYASHFMLNNISGFSDWFATTVTDIVSDDNFWEEIYYIPSNIPNGRACWLTLVNRLRKETGRPVITFEEDEWMTFLWNMTGTRKHQDWRNMWLSKVG